MFNCLNKVNPINFHTWYKLTSVIHNHNTRSKFVNIGNSVLTRTLFIPMARTSHYGLKLLKVQGPKVWNKLPSSLRIKNSINSLIKELKMTLINSYVQ